MRWIHYGRFSTDMQNPTSIEDQLRVCTEWAVREGWRFVGAYEDRGMTGTTYLRPGHQKLILDARQDKFDVVVAEALDRLSRDQEHLSCLEVGVDGAHTSSTGRRSRRSPASSALFSAPVAAA